VISIFKHYMGKHYGSFNFKKVKEKTFSYQEEKNLGLYLHIPFCESICYFCPFCKEKYTKDRMIKYINALLKEIDLTCMGQEKKNIVSIYFGGGTPSLAINYLDVILEKLRKYFSFTEIGIELCPKDITEDNLKKLKDLGVNMISVGIQTFSNKLLSSLDRERLNTDSFHELFDKYSFDVISFDLIFGVSNQAVHELISDFNKSFQSGATQVSTYPFIEFSYLKKISTQSKKEKKKLLRALVNYAESQKLHRNSVWSFAKIGSKKFSSITRDNYIGFGPSASSLNSNSFKVNTFSLDCYIEKIERGFLPTEVRLDFSKKQRVLYHLFWAVYNLEINANLIEDLFGLKVNDVFSKELKLARVLGMLRKTEVGYKITTRGAYYYHLIEQAYTNSMIDKLWGILQSDNIPEIISLN